MGSSADIGPDDTRQLQLEARRLRDYLMRVGSKAGQKLVAALVPFERGAAPAADSDAVQKLYGAFQAAYEEAATTLDRYTIDQVVGGYSPHAPQTRGAAFGAGLLTAIGILLVGLALFYSFWANSAAHTLNRAERFVEYDHFSEVMKLVEFERFFDPPPDAVEARDLLPFQMYLTAFAGLAALTLTMILVPSNTLALGASPGHPLIYLVAFIFGYSIEAFINTLNKLNRFLTTALAPKDRDGRT